MEVLVERGESVVVVMPEDRRAHASRAAGDDVEVGVTSVRGADDVDIGPDGVQHRDVDHDLATARGIGPGGELLDLRPGEELQDPDLQVAER